MMLHLFIHSKMPFWSYNSIMRYYIFPIALIQMNSNDFSSNAVFQKLKNNIQRLKVERDEVNNQLFIDRNDLSNIDSSMSQLQRQIDERMTFIREKERQLMELEKAINETEKSYEIIVDTTRKLSNALETEAAHLRGMSKK